MKAPLLLAMVMAVVFGLHACGVESPSSLNSNKQVPKGFVDIMPADQAAMYKALLPNIDDPNLQRLLRSDSTMWYDAGSIVPGYQDSMGDPEGMRPNTLRPNLIDLAVPGGHARLFAEQGRFNFPFGTGGLDDSPNAHKINFWVAPRDGDDVLPVAYWRLNWSRWRWLFPRGTVIGEVLFVKFSDDELRVFEIRTRTRTLTGWENNIFRPFPTAQSLANAIKSEVPAWRDNNNLRNVVGQLQNNETLAPYRLATTHFPGTFDPVDGHLDFVPEISNTNLTKRLLRNTRFTTARDRTWKQNGSQITYAASTHSTSSIVPRNYQAGVFQVTDDFCSRCHADAGRQISTWHDEMILYGEMWGEDQTFSWHPFKTEMFVGPNGRVRNFNDDNRRIREDFTNAGLVARYNPSTHNGDFYQELPRAWEYDPFKN